MQGRIAAAILGVGLVAAPLSAAKPREMQIEAPGPGGPLRGTMLAAGGKGPPVLIIPGSGPTDRDGNNPMGVRAAPYRLLAEGLAARGVTTVRIDKRGMFGSAGAVPDANAVTIADYVEDARSWVAAVRARTGTRCLWLLGHSEGGLVALAAVERTEGICGLILVASPGRKGGDILREQLKANPVNGPLLDQAFAAIDRLEGGGRVEASSLHPALMPLFAPQVQGFVISLFSYDPADLLRRSDRPVLVLQGQRDIQVGEEDARRLARSNAKAKLVLLANVNHVLKTVASDDRAANVATYSDPGLPLAPGVVEAIAAFLAVSKAR